MPLLDTQKVNRLDVLIHRDARTAEETVLEAIASVSNVEVKRWIIGLRERDRRAYILRCDLEVHDVDPHDDCFLGLRPPRLWANFENVRHRDRRPRGDSKKDATKSHDQGENPSGYSNSICLC
jgi:hypothetical protein